MPFWDYIHFGRSGNDTDNEQRQQYRNLQEGLLQIASQTCSILVQVNNTNNISYGHNSTNVQYNNFSPNGSGSGGGGGGGSDRSGPSGSSSNSNHQNSSSRQSTFRRNNSDTSSDVDVEQSVVLIPATTTITGTTIAAGIRGSTKNLFSHYKHRLSTVLENNTPAGDDDFELWDQNQMLRSEQQNVYNNSRWGHGGWCKPSCIPITVILTLIVLVVLLPLLEHTNEKLSVNAKGLLSPYVCADSCRIQIVESIPEGLVYSPDSPKFLSTYDAWQQLIGSANRSIDIGAFYFSLRSADIYNHSSSWQGERIFQSLLKAGTQQGIKIRIAQSQPTQSQPSYDTDILTKRKAALVRSVNFPRLIGGGVLHTKLWIVDGIHMYIGSANMDWRSLTQVKELGVLIQNCSCLVKDVSKIFNVYWLMGKDEARIPPAWPMELSTKFNYTTPLKVTVNDEYNFNSYFSSSPPQMSPIGRAQDIDAILRVIQNAEKFIYIAVMDYYPQTLYTAKIQYWPVIDDALRTAAIVNKVQVRMLISWWNHSRSSEDYYLRSLEALSKAYQGVSIEIKRFICTATDDQAKIPYARVNHNKYMVTDRTAYIGTSNWSGDYFINTAGIGLIMDDPNHNDIIEIENKQINDTDTTMAEQRLTNSTASSSSNGGTNKSEKTNATKSVRDDLESVFLRDWFSMYALDLIK